jgi:hypothetical protein
MKNFALIIALLLHPITAVRVWRTSRRPLQRFNPSTL